MTTTTTVAVIIQTDNEAFAAHPATEVGRMLHEVANTFIRENELRPRPLTDLNGNDCGEVKVLIVDDGQGEARSRAAYEHKQ